MNPSTKQTKGVWALVAVVFLLVLGGIFATVDKNNNANITTPTPTPTPTPLVVAGTESWKVYEGNGFTLRYPADFVVDENKETPHIVAPVKIYFHTILANEAYLTINPVGVTCPPSQGDQLEATTTLSSIDRTVFERVGWSGVGAGQLYKGVDYTTIHSGKCYQINLFTHSANGGGFYYTTKAQIEEVDKQHAKDMAVFIELIDKTISTFQFSVRQ